MLESETPSSIESAGDTACVHGFSTKSPPKITDPQKLSQQANTRTHGGDGYGQFIQDGDFVLLKQEGFMKTTKIKPNKTITLINDCILLDGLIGQPWNSCFKMSALTTEEMEKQQKPKDKNKYQRKRVYYKLERTQGRPDVLQQLQNDESGSDNRDIHDDGKSQTLTEDNIEELKCEGASSVELIGKIIENSSTFTQKTQYSQDKFLKKKISKHQDWVLALTPSIRLMSQMYYIQDPLSISNLRQDSLSQLLSYAGVQSGGKYIVFESGTQGLLSAAVIDRLGGHGQLLAVYDYPLERNAILVLNFNKDLMKVYQPINVRKFGKINSLKSENSADTTGVRPSSDSSTSTTDNSEVKPATTDVEMKPAATEVETPVNGHDTSTQNSDSNKRKLEDEDTKWSVLDEEMRALRSLAECNADGLLIASRHHPLNIIQNLIKYLHISRPFALFCPYQEPLMEAYTELKNMGGIINVRVFESWLRNYQVLPNRTHPEVNMSGGGGYILTGTIVQR